MAEPKVLALNSVELGVEDVAASAQFYGGPWALQEVALQEVALQEVGGRNGARYFRGSGARHHILALHPSPGPRLLAVNFGAADKAAVDALWARAKGFGVTEIDDPAPLAEPGGGYGFALKDGEGRVLRVVAGDATHAEADDVADRPRKLAHAVFNSADAHRAADFMVEVLGFRISDKTRQMNFVRCNSDHHCVAFVHGTSSTLNHIAFEMPDLDAVMRGAGRVRESGYPIAWGVGRHGPGNNVFAYFVGPEDVVVEYTGEVAQVDDDYPVGGPDDWGFPAGRVDHWGLSDPPSERLRQAQQRIAFADKLFRPAG